VINQLRGFLLEHGIPVRQGLRFLRQQLPQILATRTDVLSPRMVTIIAELIGDWKYLDERIERVTDEIDTLARADENCRRLITVPGIGPIIASAMVAAIGNGAAFAKGRDFAAWLGLVPKQMSTRVIARFLVASPSAEIGICACCSYKCPRHSLSTGGVGEA
jgi:transposase